GHAWRGPLAQRRRATLARSERRTPTALACHQRLEGAAQASGVARLTAVVLPALGRLRDHVLAAPDDQTLRRTRPRAGGMGQRAALARCDGRYVFQFSPLGPQRRALLAHRITGRYRSARDRLRVEPRAGPARTHCTAHH